jgi:hypothetical protein
MKIRNIVPVALCLMALGCTEQQSPAPDARPQSVPATEEPAPALGPNTAAIDETGPVDLDANVGMPAGFETARVETGECMTPLDLLNDQPPMRNPYVAGSDVVAVGWNITGSKENPVPEAVFGVFKPYDGASDGALLTGARSFREDIAKDDKRYEMAGFRLAGKFPAVAGKYRFYIWTGNKAALTECDSNIVVHIQ